MVAHWLLVTGSLLVVTFAAGVLSAIAGFGGALLLLPVFVLAFGARDAIAALTIVQLASNVSRVYFNRSEVDVGVLKLFAFGAVPAAVVGSVLFVVAPVLVLTRGIGVFLLLSVVWLRVVRTPHAVGDRLLVGVGAVSGLGSALLGSVGPMVAPFMLARGLTKGVYIGTEAASAVVMHATKLVVFGLAAVLSLQGVGYGIALAPASAGGSYVGKMIVGRVSTETFAALVQGGLVVAGIFLFVRG